MKKIFYILIVCIFIIGVYKLLSQPPKDNFSSSDPSNIDLVFFWGDGCPHCENVKNWLSKNNQDNKIKIDSKEVYKNIINQKNLSEIVKKYCPNLEENGNIGVPIAFNPTSQKCIQGDTPIIEFLEAKLSN